MCENLSIQACWVLGALAITPLLTFSALASNEIQPAAPVSELIAGNNAFALDLYADLTKTRDKDNLVFSPYSVCLARR